MQQRIEVRQVEMLTTRNKYGEDMLVLYGIILSLACAVGFVASIVTGWKIGKAYLKKVGRDGQ